MILVTRLWVHGDEHSFWLSKSFLCLVVEACLFFLLLDKDRFLIRNRFRMFHIQSIRRSSSSSKVRRLTRGGGLLGMGGRLRPSELDRPGMAGSVRWVVLEGLAPAPPIPGGLRGPLGRKWLGVPPTVGPWWFMEGKMVPVRPKRSKTVSMGVVNPVGPKPMNPVPVPTVG